MNLKNTVKAELHPLTYPWHSSHSNTSGALTYFLPIDKRPVAAGILQEDVYPSASVLLPTVPTNNESCASGMLSTLTIHKQCILCQWYAVNTHNTQKMNPVPVVCCQHSQYTNNEPYASGNGMPSSSTLTMHINHPGGKEFQNKTVQHFVQL